MKQTCGLYEADKGAYEADRGAYEADGALIRDQRL